MIDKRALTTEEIIVHGQSQVINSRFIITVNTPLNFVSDVKYDITIQNP